MTTVTGNGIQRFQALAVKGGLQAILRGHRVNRAYTPQNCMAMAARITGQSFKPRDYAGAIAALEAWLQK